MGRKAIDNNTKRLLWTSCAGYCQNPNCNARLKRVVAKGKNLMIDEMAHIIAYEEDGPSRLNDAEELIDIPANHFNNLIMLCPSCHTMIDKSPEDFSSSTLVSWKSQHEAKIQELFGESSHKLLRKELAKNLNPLFASNKAVFSEYGPFSLRASTGVYSEAMKEMWDEQVLSIIIPNNRQIYELFKENKELLSKEEVETVEKFKLHAEIFEQNHSDLDKIDNAPLFPKEELNHLISALEDKHA